MKPFGYVCLGAVLLLGACSSDAKTSSTTAASSGATTASAGAPTTVAGSESPPSEETSAAPADTAPADTAPADGGDGGGGPLTGDACAIVTTDEVAAAFGGTVAPGAPNENGGCDYEITGTTKTGDAGIFALVNVTINDSYISYDEEHAAVPDVEKVDGVGSDAWYLALGLQLHIAVSGGNEIVISGILPGDDAAKKAVVIDFGKVVASKFG